ncbi:vacuolar fusion protein MON1 [Kickxella alabastrina]|uniref:vacuolar fusion protein MON1 n=1 Tax=Kickxella alabastrina TaxID=61397 RepID=UPI00221E6AAF|nr:vacuolar fusion protein MON1 [Kickxella alabastrina]KAI7835133.1 vacuolar fusion protein MON1 [Kickxella alabastrina]KAJ1947535.1 Vacuolar fusion protein mon1 [Kickxella alabastrina]
MERHGTKYDRTQTTLGYDHGSELEAEERPEDFHSPEWRKRSRHFLVLSSAGKPIYSRYGDESHLSTLMSAIQAIISTFADMSDPVRSMTVGSHTLVFYTNGPLYLLAVSDRGDPEDLLRNELQILHSQIVSILTSAQLTKIFEQRSNFDLRQLLGGTETIIDQLVDRMDTDFTFLLGSLDTLWIRYRLRDRIGKALLASRPKGLLYAMMVADMKLVTLMRPRKHSLHPSDLHLLFNMSSSKNFATGEHWTPVCFPKFNDKGFLHVYLNYITPNVAIMLVSADRNSFSTISKYCQNIAEDLSTDDSLNRLDDAATQRALRPRELGVSGLLQLYYRHKTLVQHFGTRFEQSVDSDQQRRIISTYKRMRLYMTKGGPNPLRIIYHRSAEDTVLAWQSSAFELYAAVEPLMDVKVMIRLVNTVLEWIKNEEDHLFVINAPSY